MARSLGVHAGSALRLLAWFVFLGFHLSSAAQAGYEIINKIPIPGQGSWDYLAVDEAARRLYVSHGTQVEVLDVDSGAIVGKIANTLGVHGIAIAPELGQGFVSDGQSSTITIFDLKTLSTMSEVRPARSPTQSSTILPHKGSSPSMAAAIAQPQF